MVLTWIVSTYVVPSDVSLKCVMLVTSLMPLESALVSVFNTHDLQQRTKYWIYNKLTAAWTCPPLWGYVTPTWFIFSPVGYIHGYGSTLKIVYLHLSLENKNKIFLR